jgi:hypothetical protein
MKTTILTFLFAGSLISFNASAQTIKDNIDKTAKDKNTVDRAAKADVLIHKKVIADSNQIQVSPVQSVATKPAVKKVKYKRHKVKKKAKPSSK